MSQDGRFRRHVLQLAQQRLLSACRAARRRIAPMGRGLAIFCRQAQGFGKQLHARSAGSISVLKPELLSPGPFSARLCQNGHQTYAQFRMTKR